MVNLRLYTEDKYILTIRLKVSKTKKKLISAAFTYDILKPLNEKGERAEAKYCMHFGVQFNIFSAEFRIPLCYYFSFSACGLSET